MHSPLVLEKASQVHFVDEIIFRGEKLYKFSFTIDDVDKTEFFQV